MLVAALTASDSVAAKEESGVQSMLNEESPDVFLAKATLRQYLSRVVRKDWEGVRRLTHPKALAVLDSLKQRTGRERHNLAPWANSEAQLKTFRAEEQGMSVDDPSVYLLFKSRGGFLVGDKKADMQLAELRDGSVRIGYPGYVDGQAQARRESAMHGGKHR